MPLKLTAFVPRRVSKIILLAHSCDQLILPHFECLSLKRGLRTSVMQRKIWQGDSKLPPLCLFQGKFKWNLRLYLSWIMHMAFTWSPPNVATTSWCQLKSTKDYSPTNASIDRMERFLNCTTGLIFKKNSCYSCSLFDHYPKTCSVLCFSFALHHFWMTQ